MRAPEEIEAELIEISAIADDSLKFERIVAWCAAHPDEVPFALHHLLLVRHPKEDGQDRQGHEPGHHEDGQPCGQRREPVRSPGRDPGSLR